MKEADVLINDPKPETISEVASTSQLTKWVGATFFVGLIIFILSSILLGDKKDKKSNVAIQTDYSIQAPISTVSALNHQPQTDQIRSQLEAIKSNLDSGKLAEQEKLYRMRQAAPIEMYAMNTNSSAALADSESSNDLAIHSSLPLSQKQIIKLKKWIGPNDPNSQFQNDAANTPVETAIANPIPHLDFTLTQGTLIPGVLQTAVDSSLPGMVKANVTLDVYAAAGEQILIPKGSTLIGQYNSGMSMGQRRIFVVWTRLIRPDGIDIMLGSPGTDTLGQAGMEANALETHFLSRFGQASLLSIIGAGIANAGVSNADEYNSASSYREAISNKLQQSANSSLASTLMIKPTLHIYQGTRINVFVNRDLSFYAALSGLSK